MKRGIIASYVAGITDMTHGENYNRIIRYFIPELITAALMLMPFWLDALFISHLKSTTMYATLGVTNNLFHLLMKVAEAFSVGTVILTGQFNGMHKYEDVGYTVRDAFWITCLLGLFIASMLYVGAHGIYWWYGVPDDMIALGMPFLRTRAMSVFFTFIYFALIGFLRGIKNTKAPMVFFIIGSVIFITCDYVLIFGKYGFPELGLQGSALASVIQYGSMLIVALIYILWDKRNRRYGIYLFSGFRKQNYLKELITLSWPIMLDKAVLAAAYVWLCKMLCPMGTCAVATFCVIKDMERFAFLPAIAGAQVITLLVSNDYGLHNWEGIKTNIKKIIFISSLFVICILIMFGFWTENIVQLFDRNNDFTHVATRIFPILSGLVFFDVLQIILSGALRGAGNVKTVMMVRMAVLFGYFIPLSYILSHLPIADQTLKFILVYGSFYGGNALMSLMYINRFRGQDWKVTTMGGLHK